MDKITATIASIGLLGFGWFLGTLQTLQDHASEFELSATTPSVHIPARTKPADIHEMKMTAVDASTTITIPEDGWITSFRQEIGGVPESALRFTWVYDTSQKDPYCPSQQRVVFVMSVEKTPDIRFPPGHGYFVKRGTVLRIMGGFANFSDAPYDAASLSAHLSFVPLSSGRTLKGTYPLFLNAECTSLFVVPPNDRHFVKLLDAPYAIPADGTLTLLASHAHKYATEILLTLNGKELWRTSPIHLPDGTNLGNPMYRAPFNGVPVKKGDILNLRVTYSNPTSAPTDAMASIYMHLIPSNPSE